MHYSRTTIIFSLSALFFALPAFASAAITLDTAQDSSTTGTSLTISHTTTAASDRLLVAGVYIAGETDDLTGCTYNGDSLTAVNTIAPVGGNRMYLLYLLAPDSGIHDLVCSVTGSQYISVAVATYSGVAQQAYVDSSTNSNVSATTLSFTDTATVDGSLHIGQLGGYNRTMFAGANTDELSILATGEGLYINDTLINIGNGVIVGEVPGGTDILAGVTAMFSPVASTPTASTTNATSTVDQVQENLIAGLFLYIASFFLMVYLFTTVRPVYVPRSG